MSQVQNLAPHVSLGKLLELSDPQFSHLQSDDINDTIYLAEGSVWRVHMRVRRNCVTHSVQCCKHATKSYYCEKYCHQDSSNSS